MRSIRMLLMVCCFLGFGATGVRAQSAEVQQLLLNVEKLAQFKSILADMKEGYEIISSGYTAVRDISKGNFSLHETFLDGLVAVSPEVRKYHKIVGIVKMQGDLLLQYRAAFRGFVASESFTVEELDHMGWVYDNLKKQSLKNLEALLMVVTAGNLRMSDAQRLAAIDRIYADMEDKLVFLRHFNADGIGISRQRKSEKKEVSGMQKLFNVNP